MERKVNGMRKIVVGGGCFWGVQEYYRRLKGVTGTRVGYAQGYVEAPTYEQVKAQQTGHIEVCEVEYDETILTLLDIVKHLFRFIDPYQVDGQAHDIGSQYLSGVFVSAEEEFKLVEEYIASLQQQSEQQITTKVEYLQCFYDAEEYHQEYLVKNPQGYCHVDFSLIKKEELK